MTKTSDIPKTVTVALGKIKLNPSNPRTIRDDRFKKLVESIKNFPEMLRIRPIVVNEDMVILGGNMRLKACKEAGIKEVPIIIASNLSASQQREFVIKDNVGFGDWDWELLAKDWDSVELEDWGLEVPEAFAGGEDKPDDFYTDKIKAPIYEPKNEKPLPTALFDTTRAKQLLEAIESNPDIPKEERDFLRFAAYRHIVFDYGKIADYYAHSAPEVQRLMEDSALIIIDFNRAIELGYVNLVEKVTEAMDSDYQGESDE